jgi:thiol-disulfide isomerase/thioredoxin
MAPDFAKKDLTSKKITLRNLRGRYVVIDFWGTWCGPCINELPMLHELYKKYNGVQFLSVSSELGTGYITKPAPTLESVIAKYDMKWTNINENTEKDTTAITNTYKIQAFPTTMLIDPSGRVVYRGTGEKALSDIGDILKAKFVH